jgi:hypothetical protein
MRTVLKGLFGLAAALVLAVFGLGLYFLEDAPRVGKLPPPQPEDVAAVRKFVLAVREATKPGEQSGPSVVTIPTADLPSIMRLGVRFVPELRTAATVESHAVRLAASLPVPWPTGRKWLNGAVTVPPFTERFAFGSIVVGERVLPPGPTLAVGTFAANLVLGNRTGDKIRNSARAMTITGDALVFDMQLSDEDRGGVLTGVFGALRGSRMPSAEEINGYYERLRQAMDDGRLPATGSFLPHLRFVLEDAYGRSDDASLPNAYTAAVFGLARACGAQDFGLIVGRFAGLTLKEKEKPWAADCSEVTFADRIDTRRHFITAAAIKAASNRGVAISIGEFKELHDALSMDYGFDFTDIVANNSGIRMSDLLMTQPRAAWPGLLERLRNEHDVLGRFDGVPPLMNREEFARRFGDIDDPKFKAMMERIERNIDETALQSGHSAVSN